MSSVTSGPTTQHGIRSRLLGCEGYRVTSPEGHVGFVGEVLVGPDGAPAAIIARAGLFRRRVFVPLREIGAVDPETREVGLRTVPGRSS